MSDQNLFQNGEQATQPNTPATPTVDKYADQLRSIKNENGEQKYKSLEDALVALQHSQQFIPQLKSEMEAKNAELEQLKAELSKRQSIEEVVSRLSAVRQPESQATPSPSGLDEQTVMELLRKSVPEFISQRESQYAAQANQKKVQDAVKEKFGDKAADRVKEVATQYGITPEELGAWASRSPAAVLKLLIPEQSTQPAPVLPERRSSLNQPPRSRLERPAKSLLTGAKTSEVSDYLSKIREEIMQDIQEGKFR